MGPERERYKLQWGNQAEMLHTAGRGGAGNWLDHGISPRARRTKGAPGQEAIQGRLTRRQRLRGCRAVLLPAGTCRGGERPLLPPPWPGEAGSTCRHQQWTPCAQFRPAAHRSPAGRQTEGRLRHPSHSPTSPPVLSLGPPPPSPSTICGSTGAVSKNGTQAASDTSSSTARSSISANDKKKSHLQQVLQHGSSSWQINAWQWSS